MTDQQRQSCAVRGVLNGGRAICGCVINASLCGFDGECEHKRIQQQERRVCDCNQGRLPCSCQPVNTEVCND